MSPGELRATCQEGGDIAQIIERWLRVCRRFQNEIEQALSACSKQRFNAEVAFATRALDAWKVKSPSRLRPWQGAELAEMLVVASGRLKHGALAVRAFAEALEHNRRGEVLNALVSDGGCIDRAEGSLIPIARRPLDSAISDKLTARPKSCGPSIDTLESVGLLPEHMHGYGVKVRRVSDDVLRDLSKAFRMGFAALHASFEPYYQFEPHDGGAFPVYPSSEDEQWKVILRVLERADDLKLKVLVLPELCHSHFREQCSAACTWSRTVEWFNVERRHLKVLIGGSRHAQRTLSSGAVEKRNELLVLVADHQPTIHNKFNREHSEAIDEFPRTITLYASAEWSFIPLICKDFLHSPARDLVRAMHPGLVLVSSMSTKTDDFENLGRGFASDGQTVVIYANTPLEPRSVSSLGFVVRPLRNLEPHEKSSDRGSAFEAHSVGSEPTAPCIGYFDAAKKLEIERL